MVDTAKQPDPTPPAGDTSMMARATRLLIAARPYLFILLAVGGAGTGGWAVLGVGDNDRQTEVAYAALATRVNDLAREVSFLSGKLEVHMTIIPVPTPSMDEQRKAAEREAILKMIRASERDATKMATVGESSDQATDLALVVPASMPLPASLDQLMQGAK